MKQRILSTILLIVALTACNLGSSTSEEGPATAMPGQPEATATSPSQPQENADVIFHNGVILTMNRDQPTAEAIAIRGGRVEEVGENNEVLALRQAQTQVIDLGGLTLMPGFVDAHSHLFGDNFLGGQDPLPDQQVAIEYGVTTIAEFYVDQSVLNMLKTLADAGALRMRVNAYLLYTTNCGDLMGDWWKTYQPNQQIAPNLYVRGIKIFTDGGSCKAPAMSVDYPGGGKGDLFFTQEQLDQMVADVQAAGFQAAIHALGDRAVEQAQNAIAAALNGQPNAPRHRIEHNATIRPELLPRYGEIGIVPIIFGTYITCIRTTGDSGKFKYILSEEYGAWDWPWRALVDANPDLPIAWQADYHVFGTIDPIYHMWGMVTRKQVNTDGSICNPPDWVKAGALRTDEVLPMMTRNAAYALFFENEVGSLEPGKFADLVILSSNPLSVEADGLKDIRVHMTMIGGRVENCAAGFESLCPPAPPASSEAPPTTQASAPIFRDAFDGNIDPDWTWLREDASAWSLTANPGWMHINLSTGGYLLGLPSNILTRPAPQGDFDIRTSVQFSPTQNFEFAGLIVFFDEKTVLQFGRAFCEAPTCAGSGFYFDNLQNGTIAGGNFGTSSSGSLSMLRIVRQGNRYTAYYQADNASWVEIGSHSMDREPLSVGLIAAQAQTTGNYAEFDWFEINQP